MKKRLLSLVLTLAVLLAFVPAVPAAAAAAFTPVTGWDMMEKLGMGINIGNTLEALPYSAEDWGDRTHMETETAWGAAKIEQWQFKAIKQKGFDNVRIPISWAPHMGKDGKIYKEWMDRVQQCVDWALAEGLVVTINTHHENDGYYQYLGTNENYGEALKWLTNVWGQVAERFKDYPETLIFEPMNEPRPMGFGDGAWYWDLTIPEQAAGMKRLVELTNKLNHDMLDFIRKSGGNNDKRVVMHTMPQGDLTLIDRYEPPDDPYTMLGVFFYAEDGKSDRATADRQLAHIKAGLDREIPLVMKETCPDWDANTATMLEWGKLVYGELAKLGVPSQWWNCTGDAPHELFDRHTNKWNKPMMDMFFTAYGKTPGPDYVIPLNFPCTLEGPYDGEGFTYWDETIPKRELNAAEKMVVEYTGTLGGGYSFVRFVPSPWAQYNDGDKRITEEPGKLTFDMRGLEGDKLGFAMWGPGDSAKITRVYIDAWESAAPVPQSSLSNFARTQPYDNRFTDMNWSSDWVAKAYEYGIIAGTSATTYGTTGNMLIQDALVIASKIHAVYYTGSDAAVTSGANYPTSFISYAIENGITDKRFEGRYNQPATRAELAYMWSRILPEAELKRINTYEPVSDVSASHEHYEAIKLFYEAGIVTGNPDKTYKPNDPINRGECAVLFVRLVSESDRIKK